MVNCSSCGTPAPDGARFCPTCGSGIATACPNCNAETPDGAAFCPSCGFALAAGEAPEATAPLSTETRKVVSVVFADVVGFTSETERSDPEDMRARLTAYQNAVRADVERHGGKVEKLLGDGVFAVFGVPTAHEDDPERAVRAALRIQDSVEALREAGTDVTVRVAVTTGEAIIQMSDDGGEGIIGDVVNTASRLEGEAPVGGVVVDQRTYAASRRAIEFEPREPVTVKGKAEPIPVWHAIGARSRFGVGVDDTDLTPFLGRQRELSGLIDALARAEAEEAIQLVTITGEPGVGKSRLTREFFRHVDEQPERRYWRQGRCLPYGEGITFWAIGEILKAHAGILDGEAVEETSRKWDEAIGDLFAEAATATWVRRSLGPLVGLDPGSGVSDREELFAAGRSFIEAVAERDPLILVIEDLHWADGALIDFLEHLLDWASSSPVLLICTARPELFVEYPAWGGGKRSAVTVALSPLSSQLTADLLGELLPGDFDSRPDKAVLLERCSGNPLYAIEFSRLAAEGGNPEELPAEIEALVAARIDLLPEDEKRFLQVASVVGKVFWPTAVEFMSPAGTDDIAAVLRSLSAREMIRPIRRSSMHGVNEFSFWHVLVRDVAYGQLTKADRARLHESVAGWLEAANPDRLDDSAELLLHHLEQALELGRITSGDRPDLYARVHQFSLAAAARSKYLDAGRALVQLQRAVDTASDPAQRGLALIQFAQVAYSAGQLDEADQAAGEAGRQLEQAGDVVGQARAAAERSRTAWILGDGDVSLNLTLDAVAMVDGWPPSIEIAGIYASAASQHMLKGNNAEARRLAALARDMARTLGAPEEEAYAVSVLGSAAKASDPHSLELLKEGLELSLEGGFTGRALVCYNNYTSSLQWVEGPDAAAKVISEAIDLAYQRGHEGAGLWSKMSLLEHLFLAGDLPRALPLVNELAELDERRGGSQIGTGARFFRSWALYLSGDTDEAAQLIDGTLGELRKIGDVQAVAPGLAIAAAVHFEIGGHSRALTLAEEFDSATGSTPFWRSAYVHWIADGLAEAAPGVLKRMVDGAESLGPVDASLTRYAAARLAEARGDHQLAIATLEETLAAADRFGLIVSGLWQRICLARCVAATGDLAEAGRLLGQARPTAVEYGVGLMVAKIDAALDDLGAGAAG
ncbi:MAG: AAA family ATPase [Acidimicrobiia bacterium]|nr:AAA family ATPase [Acidimicrobiia bacterium]NNL69378.1 AAA family ATPase [Acidimicrobiia bacterium]